MMLIAARRLQADGELAGNVVISTVMSNLGLEKALGRLGIEMVRTPVGDKYVLEEMIRRDAKLGGEQSGHVIFRDYATTGDGMLTALPDSGNLRPPERDARPTFGRSDRVSAAPGQYSRAASASRSSSCRACRTKSAPANRRWTAPDECWSGFPVPNPWRGSWWRGRICPGEDLGGAHRRRHPPRTRLNSRPTH